MNENNFALMILSIIIFFIIAKFFINWVIYPFIIGAIVISLIALIYNDKL